MEKFNSTPRPYTRPEADGGPVRIRSFKAPTSSPRPCSPPEASSVSGPAESSPPQSPPEPVQHPAAPSSRGNKPPLPPKPSLSLERSRSEEDGE